MKLTFSAVAMAMATAAAMSARHVYQVGGRYGYYDYPSVGPSNNGDYLYQEDDSGSLPSKTYAR